MLRSSNTIAARAAALLLVVAASATAQSTDTTRVPPQGPPDRGAMGPMRGMRPRLGPGVERGRDDVGPRAGERMRRMEGGRGRFGPGARSMGAARRAGAGPRGLLRGITLSTEQEKALRGNQARHLSTTKPLMLELMSARTDEQVARLNGDQKALDAATARVTAARGKLDSLRTKRSPTDDLRAVLTPDQQKLLDRNLTEGAAAGRFRGAERFQGRGEGRGEERGDGMAPRGFRPGGSPRGFRDGPLPARRGIGEASDSAFDPELFELFDLTDDEPVAR